MNTQDWKTAAQWFVPGFIVGMVVLSLFQSFQTRSSGSGNASLDAILQATEDGSADADTNTQATNVKVSVNNQPAGRAVLVESATLTQVGWLAVRDVKSDGSIGNILGAVLRDKGTSEKVVVDLLRATEPDKRYAVVLFTDDGDKKFDSKKDTVVNDSDGKPQRFEFTAQTPVAPTGR